MSGVRRRLQQPLDQLRALVRVFVGEERPHLRDARDAADEVEVHAADVLGVVRPRRGGDLASGPVVREAAVDAGGESPRQGVRVGPDGLRGEYQKKQPDPVHPAHVAPRC
jgi:hypothetical protein